MVTKKITGEHKRADYFGSRYNKYKQLAKSYKGEASEA
jgi:hypothetical protein